MFFKKNKKNFPKVNHIGFIMDGNRRYSKKERLSLEKGYKKGLDQFLKIIRYQILYNIKETSFYALSRDNYLNRKREELNILKDLIFEFYNSKDSKVETFFKENKIKINILGNLDEIKSNLKKRGTFEKEILNFEKEIKKWNDSIKNPKFVVNICLNYDGQEEILYSFKEILKKLKKRELKEKDLDLNIIKDNIYFSKSKPPEIIVRTGNAPRLSGFMLWDSKYSEIYLTKKLWPELTKKDFEDILIWYSKIKRNFGK